jgi:hypothetical protein
MWPSETGFLAVPWLDRQGWVSLGSKQGGHQFTLGSTPLYVMETLSLGRKPEGKVLPPDIPPPPPIPLPPEFEHFADVFSPQTNCTLPLHRSMHISINLEEGSVPPFGGLYNLLLDEQSQLKSYIDKNLKKRVY